MQINQIIGNELIKVLGKNIDIDDEELITVLNNTGLTQEHFVMRGLGNPIVYDNESLLTHIVLSGGKNKISTMHFFADAFESNGKREAIFPFGLSRYNNSKEDIFQNIQYIKSERVYVTKQHENFYMFYMNYDDNYTIDDVELQKISENKYNKLLGNRVSSNNNKNKKFINKFKSDKLKKIATYILQEDKNYNLINSLILGVDWREHDENIVNCCEGILNTGELKAELVNVDISTHNPHGYEIYIHYKGKKHLVEYGQEVLRWKTINRLNQVISDTYQMRLLLSSLDSDTHDLIVLSHQEWEALEKVLGKEKVADYVEFVDNEFF